MTSTGSAATRPSRLASWAVPAAVAVIAAAVVPWTDLQDHAHWEAIGWLPFMSWPVSAFDIVANIALFIPLGAAVARRSRTPLLVAMLFAAGLSLAGETLQLYSHTRFPSATDLVTNVGGALIGALLVRRSRTT